MREDIKAVINERGIILGALSILMFFILTSLSTIIFSYLVVGTVCSIFPIGFKMFYVFALSVVMTVIKVILRGDEI